MFESDVTKAFEIGESRLEVETDLLYLIKRIRALRAITSDQHDKMKEVIQMTDLNVIDVGQTKINAMCANLNEKL